MTEARIHRLGAAVVAAVLFGLAGAAAAQEKAPPPDVAAQANNPLANFTAFNVHNYYIGELTDSDETGNTFWMRFAKPFRLGKTSWLMRASLPVNTLPVGETLAHETGLGDLNVFAAYLIPMGGRKLSVGIGPQITAPTASKDGLGADKWSVGLVHTLLQLRLQEDPVRLAAELAGGRRRRREEAADVNLGPSQPFHLLSARPRHVPAFVGGLDVQFREQTPTPCRSGSASARSSPREGGLQRVRRAPILGRGQGRRIRQVADLLRLEHAVQIEARPTTGSTGPRSH